MRRIARRALGSALTAGLVLSGAVTAVASPGLTRPQTVPGPPFAKVFVLLVESGAGAPRYSPAHYRRLYFGRGQGVESLRTYYAKQSSGRHLVDGLVTDWVKVPPSATEPPAPTRGRCWLTV